MDNHLGPPVIRPTVPVMTDWELPGYDDLRLLGFGSAGELWAGRDRSSGAGVALRRLPGADPGAIEQVRAAATVLRSLPSPHLIRVRTTLRSGGDDVVVLDLAEGGPLAAVVARRGALAPGEVVTAVAPLAEAVGQAHTHGLRHGRLALSSVLLTADGMPLLDGLGTAALHDPADGLDPTGGLGDAADVWALGELCRLLLTGDPEAPVPVTSPLPLRQAVEAALGPDPRNRPTAGDLAAALLASCPALPLPVPVGSSPVPPPPGRAQHAAARRPSGQVLAGAVAAVVLLLVGVAGWAWGGRTERPAELAVRPAPGAAQPGGPSGPGISGAPGGGRISGPRAELAASDAPDAPDAPVALGAPGVGPTSQAARLSVPVDERQVVEGVDAARAAAFAAADPQGLLAVYAPGSPQQAPDAAAIAALARLRRTAVGVRHDVRSVRVRQRSADRLDLEVVESLRAYEVRDVAGTVVAGAAAGPDVHVEMLLRRVGAAWRVEQVRAARA